MVSCVVGGGTQFWTCFLVCVDHCPGDDLRWKPWCCHPCADVKDEHGVLQPTPVWWRWCYDAADEWRPSSDQSSYFDKGGFDHHCTNRAPDRCEIERSNSGSNRCSNCHWGENCETFPIAHRCNVEQKQKGAFRWQNFASGWSHPSLWFRGFWRWCEGRVLWRCATMLRCQGWRG